MITGLWRLRVGIGIARGKVGLDRRITLPLSLKWPCKWTLTV